MFDHCIPGYIYLLGLALLPVSVQCLIIVYLAIFTCPCPMIQWSNIGQGQVNIARYTMIKHWTETGNKANHNINFF
jgi:hypothetical protein